MTPLKIALSGRFDGVRGDEANAAPAAYAGARWPPCAAAVSVASCCAAARDAGCRGRSVSLRSSVAPLPAKPLALLRDRMINPVPLLLALRGSLLPGARFAPAPSLVAVGLWASLRGFGRVGGVCAPLARRLVPFPPPSPSRAPAPLPLVGLAGAAPLMRWFDAGGRGLAPGPCSLRSQSLRVSAARLASPLVGGRLRCRCAPSGPCRAVCAPASPRAPVGWWRRCAPGSGRFADGKEGARGRGCPRSPDPAIRCALPACRVPAVIAAHGGDRISGCEHPAYPAKKALPAA